MSGKRGAGPPKSGLSGGHGVVSGGVRVKGGLALRVEAGKAYYIYLFIYLFYLIP